MMSPREILANDLRVMMEVAGVSKMPDVAYMADLLLAAFEAGAYRDRALTATGPGSGAEPDPATRHQRHHSNAQSWTAPQTDHRAAPARDDGNGECRFCLGRPHPSSEPCKPGPATPPSGSPPGAAEACRRCSECQGARHHWIPSDEESEGAPDYACKHCDVGYAWMCIDCDEPLSEPDTMCATCSNEGDDAASPPESPDGSRGRPACPCGDWAPGDPSRPGHPDGWCAEVALAVGMVRGGRGDRTSRRRRAIFQAAQPSARRPCKRAGASSRGGARDCQVRSGRREAAATGVAGAPLALHDGRREGRGAGEGRAMITGSDGSRGTR